MHNSYAKMGDLSSLILPADQKERRKLRDAVRFLLLDKNGLASVSMGMRGKGTSPTTACALLGVVLEKTFPFDKVIEHLRIRILSDGEQGTSLPGIGVSQCQAKRAVNALIKDGLLFDLNGRNDGSPARGLGLDMPEISRRLRDYEWGPDNTRSGKKRDEAIQLVTDYFLQDQIVAMYDWLRGKVIKTWDAFMAEFRSYLSTARTKVTEVVKKTGDAMRALPERIQNAAKIEHERFVEKRLKKANGTFSRGDANGQTAPLSDRALLYWQTCVEDTESYKNFTQPMTKKAGRMMKNWLNEKALGDDEMRALIKRVVFNWHKVKGQWIHTANGKNVRIAASPSFEYFYMYRSQIIGLLDEEDAKLYKIKTGRRKKGVVS